MLRSKLSRLKNLMVIGKDSADSKCILDHFVQQVPNAAPGEILLGQRGFTNFVVEREGRTFLEA
jgi:hypothetical protein